MTREKAFREEDPIDITVVCAVTRFAGDLPRIHEEFQTILARLDRRVEFIYVLRNHWPTIESSLARVRESVVPVRVLRLPADRGEGVALQIGFESARGRYVLTIPDRPQVEATAVLDIVHRLDQGEDVVVTRREPRSDAWLNRLQSGVFHALIKKLVRVDFQDMTSELRGMTREAALRLDLYGDQHRFIPVIAVRSGYGVVEIPAPQHPENRALRLYGPGVYVRRLLDILNIFFLTRFTRKPLRFFGLIGMAAGLLGFSICAVVSLQRILGYAPLANRPILILGVLLIVLGVQVVSVGLLGEIILFLSAKRETPVFREVRHPDPDLESPSREQAPGREARTDAS